MLNIESLRNLYDLVINDQMLTQSRLNDCGFNENDIKKLIELGKIKRLGDDIYKYIGVIELCSYGKELLNKRQYDKARLCFSRCLEINPSHKKSAFYLFSIDMRRKQYDKAFISLEVLINSNDYNQNDNNLYLFLLSYIIELPDKYKKMVNEMLYDDVKYGGTGLHVDKINVVRELILRRKFSLALRKLNDFIGDKEVVHASDYIIRWLLKEIMMIKSLRDKKIEELVQNKDYEAIINLLENSPNLLLHEKYIFMLANIYTNIDKTKEIPVPNLEYTPDFFMAIERNNFSLAQTINKDSNDIFSIILDDLITKITKEKIFISLESQNLEEVFLNLKQFLIRINKVEYEKRINNIIRLCFVKEDDSFEKLREVLNLLEENNVFDIKYYIEKVDKLINEKNYSEAKFYIGIINNLEKDDLLTKDLNRKLELARNGNFKQTENQNKQEKDKKSGNKNNLNKITGTTEYIFLEQISKRIKDEKIIIITKEKEIEMVTKVINYFPNMQSFKIEYNGNIQLVLKFKQKVNVDFNELIKKGNEAYKNGNYLEAIKWFELLNSVSSKNRAFCYARLGWSYFRIQEKEQALKYFVIADYLNKIEKNTCKLDTQIRHLEKSLENKMDITYFEDNSNDNCNIEVLEEIVNLINSNSISIDEACLKFHLNEIQVNIIKLIIAKDCYSQKDYITGDKLLKMVEKSNHKNKVIVDLLNELRKNKMFYKNRIDKQDLISNTNTLIIK